MDDDELKVGDLVKFNAISLTRTMYYPYYENKKYGLILKIDATEGIRRVPGEWYFIDYPVAWVRWCDGDVCLMEVNSLERFTNEKKSKLPEG